MNARRLHRCVLWLLPLFVLRAFIPAGYMLSPSAAGLQIVFCSGTGPTGSLPSTDHAAHASLHADAHAHHVQGEAPAGQHSEHQAHERSVCPYAVAGSAYAPGVAHFLADSPAIAVSIVDFPSDPSLTSAPVLIDRIRGPPLA
jgi:hypothetical protein